MNHPAASGRGIRLKKDSVAHPSVQLEIFLSLILYYILLTFCLLFCLSSLIPSVASTLCFGIIYLFSAFQPIFAVNSCFCCFLVVRNLSVLNLALYFYLNFFPIYPFVNNAG